MNRREALRTLAAGSAAAALAAGAVVAVTPAEALAANPCLAFVTTWTAMADACDSAPNDAKDAFYDAHCHPFEIAALEGRVPDATTAKGAATALRKILEFDDIEGQDITLLRAALAYLEGRA